MPLPLVRSSAPVATAVVRRHREAFRPAGMVVRRRRRQDTQDPEERSLCHLRSRVVPDTRLARHLTDIPHVRADLLVRCHLQLVDLSDEVTIAFNRALLGL
jgi:hypothetical protein